MVRVGGILDDEVSRSAQAELVINVLEVPVSNLPCTSLWTKASAK